MIKEAQEGTKPKLRHYIPLVIVPIVWGSTFPVSSYLFNDLKTPIPFVLLFRFFFASIAIFLMQRKVKVKQMFKKNYIWAIITGIFLALGYIFQNEALLDADSNTNAVITNLTVVFVPLFGIIFFKDKFRINIAFAALLAFLGAYMITMLGDASDSSKATGIMGWAFSFIGCIGYSAQVILNAKKVEKVNSVVWIFWVILFATIAFALYTGWALIANHENIRNFDFSILGPEAIASVLYLTIICTIFPFVVRQLVLKIIPSEQAIVFLSTEILWAAIIGLFFGFSLNILQGLGFVVMLAAIFVSERMWKLFSKNRKNK